MRDNGIISNLEESCKTLDSYSFQSFNSKQEMQWPARWSPSRHTLCSLKELRGTTGYSRAMMCRLAPKASERAELTQHSAFFCSDPCTALSWVPHVYRGFPRRCCDSAKAQPSTDLQFSQALIQFCTLWSFGLRQNQCLSQVLRRLMSERQVITTCQWWPSWPGHKRLEVHPSLGQSTTLAASCTSHSLLPCLPLYQSCLFITSVLPIVQPAYPHETPLSPLPHGVYKLRLSPSYSAMASKYRVR